MHHKSIFKAYDFDCDENNELKISTAMRYMQQSSGDHMTALGVPYENLLAEGMVFLLSKSCIKIHRNPKAREELHAYTAPVEFRGAKFMREFVIEASSGERLISAFTLWILVEPASRKILRPSSYPHAMPFTQASRIKDIIDDIRITKPETARPEISQTVDVRHSHIDCNGHVNNAIYADFVCDILPREQLLTQKLDTLVISFQNEAKHGNTVNITANKLPDNSYYISGKKENGACFEAMANFK